MFVQEIWKNMGLPKHLSLLKQQSKEKNIELVHDHDNKTHGVINNIVKYIEFHEYDFYII